MENIKGGMDLNLLPRSYLVLANQYEALLRRLTTIHPKRDRIKDHLETEKAGYWGETRMDYHLDFLPNKEYWMFNGLRLIQDGKAFQIDTLVLHRNFGVIVETKNMGGTLVFDKSNQLIRIKDGREEGFQDPIAQAKRQRWQLQRWLHAHKFPEIPLEYLVAIGKPSTILKIDQDSLLEKILHVIHIPEKILELEKRYCESALSHYYLEKLSRSLIADNTPRISDVLSYYSISKDEIRRGVQCPKCFALPMVRSKASWLCPHCRTLSKKAHQQAIQDYLLLIEPTITKQKCREFLLLESRNLAYKFMQTMDLCAVGSGKGVVYSGLTHKMKK